MRRSLFFASSLLFLFFFASMNLRAAPTPGESLLIHRQGDTQLFVFTCPLAVPKDSYLHYWRRNPCRIEPAFSGETLSVHVHYESYSSDSGSRYRLFAWGRALKPLGGRKVLVELSGNEKKEMRFDFPSAIEDRLALLLNRTAETGFNFFNLPAFRDSADEKRLALWSPLLKLLATNEEDRRFGRGGGHDVDLYSVFTGLSAIEESLQVGVTLNTAPRPNPGANSCFANVRVIQGALEMYNMDHANMLSTLDGSALELMVKEKYLRSKPTCPLNGVYRGEDLTGSGLVRCSIHGHPEKPGPDVSTSLEASMDVRTLTGPGTPSHPWAKMIKNPGLALPDIYSQIPDDVAFVHFPDYTAFSKSFDFFDDWGGRIGTLAGGASRHFNLEKKIKDQLLLKTDLMTRLLADFAIGEMLFVTDDPFLFEGTAFAVLLKITNETMLREKLAMTAAAFRKEHPEIQEKQEKIDGQAVQLFVSPDARFQSYRFTQNGYFVLTNSPSLAGKILAVGTKKNLAMADSLDLRYFQEHLDAKFPEKSRVFAFLSDAFIRKILSAPYKIAEKRRLECLRAMTLAAFDRALQAGEDAKQESCPEKGAYSWSDNVQTCSFHRHYGQFKPLCEILPDRVDADEAQGYKAFVANYNNYFRQFFDPIGFVFTVEPNFRGRLLIMPLIENGLYSGLQANLAHEPGDPGPDLENAVLRIGVHLKPGNLPNLDPFRHNPEGRRISEKFARWFEGMLWIDVPDQAMVFHWDTNLATRGLLGSLGAAGQNVGFAWVPPFVMSIFSPGLLGLKMNNPGYFEEILAEIENQIQANRHQMSGFGPMVRLSEIAAPGGESTHVLAFEFFAIHKTYYLKKWNQYLLIASQRSVLEKVREADALSAGSHTGNFNLLLYPGRLKVMRPDLIEQRSRAGTRACLENLKRLSVVNLFSSEGDFLGRYRSVHHGLPLCPAKGNYSPNEHHEFACSVHGTLKRPVQAEEQDILRGIQLISIQSFIEPEGFQGELEFK